MLMMMIHDVNDGYNDSSDYGGDKNLGQMMILRDKQNFKREKFQKGEIK